MFDESAYVDSGEVFEVLRVGYETCQFEGNLFSRIGGGFDLFLMRENSEFECLEIDVITRLRQQAQGDDLVFVERFAEPGMSRELKKRVEERFVQWLETNLGLRPGSKYKMSWGEA